MAFDCPENQVVSVAQERQVSKLEGKPGTGDGFGASLCPRKDGVGLRCLSM